jgi:hypothetical protein
VVEEVCRLAGVACPDVDLYLPERARISVDVVAGQTRQVEVVYGCALLEPPDAVLASALLEAVREHSGDPEATLSCGRVAQLQELVIFGSPFDNDDDIRDLEGLQHARRLERLVLSHQFMTDLTPLSGLAELRVVQLSGGFFHTSPLTDLGPLANLAKLEELSASYSQVATIPRLASLPHLRVVRLAVTKVTDLSPLVGASSLEELEVRGCLLPFSEPSVLADLSPLAGLTTLRLLTVACHTVSDVSPLAGLTALETLDLEQNRIADIEPLAGLEELRRVSIRINEVTSIETVRHWPKLEHLSADYTRITDVRPLQLHAYEHRLLERVNLSVSCVAPTRVPTAWYLDDLRGRGITLTASESVTCSERVRPAPAISTFELSPELWTTSGDATFVRWLSSGGPTGGPHLEAEDQQSGAVWYWEAPPKFFGDASGFHGGQLRVWLKQSSTSNQFASDDIVLEGAGMTLRYRHNQLVGTDWTEIMIPLSTVESGDRWYHGAEVADESMLQSVLADLTRLRVRGEFRNGADTGGLGFVSMAAEAE